MASQPLRVGVDVGGTFTDLVAAGAHGCFEIRKVLSTPDDAAAAVFGAVDQLPGSGRIASLVLGTTIATNAAPSVRGSPAAGHDGGIRGPAVAAASGPRWAV
jgi:N-methylhydantoinase A